MKTVVRMLAVGALGTGMALALPAAAPAADLADLTVVTEGGTTTFTLHSVETGAQFIPRGGEPTAEEPAGEPEVGDAFGFTDDLTQHGKLVGTDKGRCTILEFGVVNCAVEVTFADGTIDVQGKIAEDEEGPGVFDLVAGTGAYTGIDGTATVVDNDDESQTITVTYTRADAAQVSEVASGGAATGGAIPADRTPAEPKATVNDGDTTITVHAVEIADSAGADSEDSEDSEDSAPKVGESFTFEEKLSQDGVLVGKDRITCTVTAVTAANGTLRCDGALTFARGALQIADSLTFPLGESAETEPPFDVAIVSGTGVYSGARGTAHIVPQEDESSDLTLRFRTVAGQVSVVPAGGAATGGGRTAPGTDSALLIGVGVAAIAGSAGLFGTARFTGRRA